MYVSQVDPRVCYARGRGWEAYVMWHQEAVACARTILGKLIYTVEGDKIYDPLTRIVLDFD